MKSRKFTALVIITFSLSMFLYFNFGANAPMNADGFKGIEPIVIFDVAHYQKFNNTQMQSAIQFIEDEYEIDVIINKENFTLTNLRGADLLILPAPYYQAPSTGGSGGAGPYSAIEQRAVLEFYQDGGSVLYLANPYFFETSLRNYSSNLNHINYLMAGGTEDESNYDGLAFDQPIHTLMNDFNNRYNDERLIYINNETLAVNHSIIMGLPNSDPVNELLIHSTSIIRAAGTEKLINTTSTTYEVNSDGEVPFGGTKSYTILAVEEKATSRAMSCASAIMFSDLPVTEGETTTWWETYDNALLWKNMIYWLLLEIPVNEPPKYLPDFGFFTIIFAGVFFVLLVIGSLLFTVGRETKRAEVSEVIIKMRERDERRKEVDEEIEAAYYAEETATPTKTTAVEEVVEDKEVDMQSISDEVRKKPPKTRSRSERRRTG